jgi:hypothetical protein
MAGWLAGALWAKAANAAKRNETLSIVAVGLGTDYGGRCSFKEKKARRAFRWECITQSVVDILAKEGNYATTVSGNTGQWLDVP